MQVRQRLGVEPFPVGLGELADEGEDRGVGDARRVAAQVAGGGQAFLEGCQDG